MARNNNVRMPSSQSGIVNYFEDYKSKLHFRPEHVVVLVIVVILIEVFLHWKGMGLLG